MQKARGSAIVIAMLLVSAVGTVGFTFGKVLDIQISNSSAYESGIGAYYAAESGLEEGFLRYRVSQGKDAVATDGQVPTFYTDTHPSQSWLVLKNNVIRTNLSGNAIIGDGKKGLSKSTSLTDLNAQYYDLRMGSASDKFESIGNLQTVPSEYHIIRDATAKIDLGNIFSTGVGSNITLFFSIPKNSGVDNPPVFNNDQCTLVEAKLELQEFDGGPIVEKKKLLKNSNSGVCSLYSSIISDSSGKTTIDYTLVPYPTVPAGRIAVVSDLKTKLAPSTPYSRATLFLKPIGSDIDYMISETNSYPEKIKQNPLHNTFSIVTSTGYYGGVARTLKADISLKSGALYDLYDYVIFKNN